MSPLKLVDFAYLRHDKAHLAQQCSIVPTVIINVWCITLYTVRITVNEIQSFSRGNNSLTNCWSSFNICKEN